jgi:hypothetical protein
VGGEGGLVLHTLAQVIGCMHFLALLPLRVARVFAFALGVSKGELSAAVGVSAGLLLLTLARV